jgi:hypothetical protein
MKRATALPILVWFLALLPAAANAADGQGEIRLRSALSALPYQMAVGPEGQFIVVSGRDGVITEFDLNIKERKTLYFSPIREEEPERERPVAVSPSGDLIALGAPLELGTPNTARIYFFAHAAPRRTIFTIDNLPARPTVLRFLSDKNGDRLRLIVGFANGQAPSVWDVTGVARAIGHPEAKVSVLKGVELAPPRPDFFSNCGRSECDTLTIAVPPKLTSGVGLIIGTDSGLALYDQNFDVLAYGAVSNGRPDLRRVASVSLSDDGSQFAVGKLSLRKDEAPDNQACRVDVYDLRSFKPGVDQRFDLEPRSLQKPKLKEGESETDQCNFARVAWSGHSIFATGVYWLRFERVAGCKTNKDLDERYDPEAMAMLRWDLAAETAVDVGCVGTNRVMDLQPVPGGGVAAITQDPLFAVYDAPGRLSHYPSHTQERVSEGDMLDLRDNVRGDMSVNDDGSLVLVRPLLSSKTYVALDLKTSGLREPLWFATASTLGGAKADLIRQITQGRGGQTITLSPRSVFPQQCLGWELPVGKDLDALVSDFDGPQRHRLPLRSQEQVRDVEFLAPMGQSGGGEWRVVFGTSHRILYADCSGHDLWHANRPIANFPAAGRPLRDDAYQVRVSGDRRFLIAAHGDGVLRWYELASGRLAWSVFVNRDLTSWIAWAPDGHFDSSEDMVDWSVGWLQSVARGQGIWSITMEPLAKYEQQWREPNLLRNRISLTNINTNIAQGAPDQGDPEVTIEKVAITAGEKASATLTLRVDNFFGNGKELASGIEIRADAMGVVKPARFESRSIGGHYVIEEDFQLNECQQQDGRAIRISARFKNKNAQDSRIVEYKGSTLPCNLPRVWGVVVGISKYDRLPELNYADQDAESFFEFWSRGGGGDGREPYYDIGRLTLISVAADGSAKRIVRTRSGEARDNGFKVDRDSLRDAIKNELSEFQKAKPSPDDILVLYLGGHGTARPNGDNEEWFFFSPDGDLADLDTTAISAKQMKKDIDSFDQLPANMLIFVDACRNLSVAFPANPKKRRKGDLQAFAAELNATILLAASSDHPSYEFTQDDLENPKDVENCTSSGKGLRGAGVFTHVLLRLFEKAAQSSGKIDKLQLDSELKDGVGKICSKQRPLVRIGPNDEQTDLWLRR